ncbi:hypothetical protein NM688_g2720 [Phlebia brevispora]|uniref:Uncharacterized protein n=1 Tax=Phlebia brevispora TaxID=194682 RepID=A0ACC1T816_9APHY|nr:hypothetical protein NM688_g2720 [Phlebia brevispora]
MYINKPILAYNFPSFSSTTTSPTSAMVSVTVQYADKNIYSKKLDLKAKCLAAVETSWIYDWARNQNIATLYIMGGIHRSWSDRRNHLTVRANSTKGFAQHLKINPQFRPKCAKAEIAHPVIGVPLLHAASLKPVLRDFRPVLASDDNAQPFQWGFRKLLSEKQT